MILVETIEKSKSLFPILLPDLFSNAHAGEVDYEEELAVIPYTLPHGYDIEDVLDNLEDQMELTILYHFVPSEQTDFGHQCCAYSNTQFGHMYKIHAITNDKGLVDSLTVTLYSSMDVMCTDLLEDLDRHEGHGKFIHKLSKENLLVEFC